MFGRRGDNLTVELPVSYPEAALGANVEVPTLNGPVTLKVPAGTPNGQDVPRRGKGAPKKGGHGDLLVTVNVDVPGKLSREEKQLLKQLRDAQKESPRKLGVRGVRCDGRADPTDATRATSAPSTSSAWRPSSPECIRRRSDLRAQRTAPPERTRATPAATPTPTSSCCERSRPHQEEGVNLAGVKRIMELRARGRPAARRVEELQEQLAHRRAIAMPGRRVGEQIVPLGASCGPVGEPTMTDVQLVTLRLST